MKLQRGARTCRAGRALLVGRVLEAGWTVTRAAEASWIGRRTAHPWLSAMPPGTRPAWPTAAGGAGAPAGTTCTLPVPPARSSPRPTTWAGCGPGG